MLEMLVLVVALLRAGAGRQVTMEALPMAFRVRSA